MSTLESAARETRAAMLASQLTASIPFVIMAQEGMIDAVTAAEHAELFAAWASGVSYARKAIVRGASGALYQCLQAHTSQADWAPEKAASLWVMIGDPADEWPAWVAWVGGMDTYGKGAKVTHGGKRWTSTVDGNVWEPGVYGWTEVKA